MEGVERQPARRSRCLQRGPARALGGEVCPGMGAALPPPAPAAAGEGDRGARSRPTGLRRGPVRPPRGSSARRAVATARGGKWSRQESLPVPPPQGRSPQRSPRWVPAAAVQSGASGEKGQFLVRTARGSGAEQSCA